METYVERINQFVVEYHEELPEEYKAEYRLNGVDPDNRWLLQWSFTDKATAVTVAREEQERHDAWCNEKGYDTWKIWRWRDLGAPKEIIRNVLF